MIAGCLSACDWLSPVTRGVWRMAPPIDWGGGGGVGGGGRLTSAD